MSYTDPDAVRVALTPGGDDADVGTAAYLNDGDFLAAIADATDEVNVKLAVRYTVPFADGAVPDIIKTISTAIAAYLATLTARGGDPLDRQDPVALRNARAVLLLSQLQNGTALLDGVNPAPSSNEAMPLFTDPDSDYLYTYGLPTAVGYGFTVLQI